MEEKFELLQFIKIIRERKRIILLGILISLFVAKLATDFMPPAYETSVQMLVSQGQVRSQDEPVGESYQAILLSERLTATLSQMLTNRTLAERVIEKLGLPLDPEDLQDRIRTEPIENTQLIRLDVTASDPRFAKKLADTYAAEFIKMSEEVIPPSAFISIKVVDRAALPQEPVWPSPLLNLIQAFIVGLALSTGFAFILGMLDVTVKDAEEVEQLINLPSLGQVPSAKNPALLDKNDSVTAEVYRSLRTNLRYVNFDQSIGTLAISSPGINEGKTTVATNLAIVFAQAGYKVLLVDSDLRSPRLGKLFNKLSGGGISNVLVGMIDAQSVIQDTDVAGLYFMASGPVPPNPADLLSSERMDKLLKDLGENFDLVILDCPPILAVADTTILAAKIDAVLLVSRFGKTKKSEMSAATNALSKVGARVIGFVVNKAEMDSKGKYARYYRKPRPEQKAA